MPDTFDPDRVAWVFNERDLAHLLVAIEESAEVVMDLETTGLDEEARTGGLTNGGVAARVSLAALTLPSLDVAEREPTTWIVPLSHPQSPFLGCWRTVLAQISAAIIAADKPLTNQNVKFDAKWVAATAGVDLSTRISWCTQVSSHLLDETSSTRLKDRAPATFGVTRWDDFDLTYPGASEQVPLIELGLYAARDTYWTHKLAALHRAEMFLGAEGAEGEVDTPDEIERARLGRLAVWCAMPTVASLTAVEERGFALDVSWVQHDLAEHERETARLTEELASRYGMDLEDASWAATSGWFKEWTVRAVDAGDLRVAALTPNGAAQWSKGVLVRQARGEGGGVAVDLLAVRSHVKKAEYLRSWLTHVAADGAIHTTYHVGSVVTGRLSSSGPNMQQVTASLKPAFIPRPGFVIADLDYSQIELRVAAFISRCEPMIAAFRRGDDLHRLLAARITGKAPEEVSPGERQAGKSANFGLLYGMGAYGFQQYAETVYGVSFTDAEAQLVYRTFFDTWDGLAQWHRRAAARARNTGQVTSPIGRVRRLPQIFDSNEGRASYAERAAINAPVQGFGSDLMQMAAASIGGYLPGYSEVSGAHIVATVHDSIVVEVPEHGWQSVVTECVDRMLDLAPVLKRMDCDLDVPLAVSAKIGTRWGLGDVAVLD